MRAQQTGLTAEKLRLEQALDKQPTDPALKLYASPPGAASKRIATKAFSLCDRPEAIADYITHFSPAVRIPEHAKAPDDPAEAPSDKLKIYASPEERDVCQRDGLLATSFRIVHNELQQFKDHWPSMIGGVFNAPSKIFSVPSEIAGLFGGLWNQAQAKQEISGKPQAEASSPPRAPTPKAASNEDVEFIIAPLLLVLGNYVLPIIFGFLGSLMFVILDLYGKLKESRLDPRDNALSWLRLVLGLATGACIGLFMSSYAPPASPAAAAASGTASGLASSLTLSASGLAFLAGFGVEGVFRMLQALVGRVFASDTREPVRT